MPPKHALERLTLHGVSFEVGWHRFGGSNREILRCRGAKHLDVVCVPQAVLDRDEKRFTRGCPLGRREVTTSERVDKVLDLIVVMRYLSTSPRRA